ncbi:hypothetical protein AB0M45_30885 [Nocardia sp. NPDC051787]|uniref:hypothetical protein n=1 Tax=Nocardia sp. NPDC051787 TaxID=3155415 RepID=UPI0034333706
MNPLRGGAVPHVGDVAPRLVTLLVMEPGSLVMERKMLRGIESRAERRGWEHRPPEVTKDPFAQAEGPYTHVHAPRTLEI